MSQVPVMAAKSSEQGRREGWAGTCRRRRWRRACNVALAVPANAAATSAAAKAGGLEHGLDAKYIIWMLTPVEDDQVS